MLDYLSHYFMNALLSCFNKFIQETKERKYIMDIFTFWESLKKK